MEGFFDEQCGVVCRLIQHLDLVPKHLVVTCSAMADFSSSHLLPCLRLVFFDAGLKGSLCLTYVYTATATRDLVYNVGLLLLWISIFDLHQLPAKGGC